MSSQMFLEIQEQPQVLGRLLSEGWSRISGVSSELRQRDFRYAMLAARGTSDNAAYYGKYLLENLLGIPTAFASPSSFTIYGASLDLRDALVIGVSQSGQGKDVLEVLESARQAGAATVSITNDEESPLALTADHSLPLLAEVEQSVAATKTYTAELMVLYLLVQAMNGASEPSAEALEVPDRMQKILDTKWSGIERYRYAEYMTIVSRGYNLATAKEAALKLMETSYTVANAFSAADLRHGPVAMIGRDSPVLALVPPGEVRAGMMELLRSLTTDNEAELLVVGDAKASDYGAASFVVPGSIPEILSPILYSAPIQMLAESLAKLKRRDPDLPRGLKKVTETW